MKKFLKHIALTVLPPFVLQRVKKHHYLNKLKKASLNDEKDLMAITLLVSAGDTVVDIGANVGLYTRFLSEAVTEKGKVFSIEPVQSTFDILVHNIEKLRLQNVTCVNLAVSDTAGSAEMFIPEYESGGENIYEAGILRTSTHQNGRHISVRTDTLDNLLFDKTKHIHLIKCDTEGHEMFVMKGAAKILQRDKPALMVEINDDISNPATNGFKLAVLLKEKGYGIFCFDGEALQKFKGKAPGVNYFFLQETGMPSL